MHANHLPEYVQSHTLVAMNLLGSLVNQLSTFSGCYSPMPSSRDVWKPYTKRKEV